jgi:single-stranded-DNA-specific exonuclease
VLGLAASRLAESYNRPVFLYGRNEAGDWKGSCRTAGQLNVVELMRAASLGEPLFTDLGGHMAAGGFSISPEIAPSGVEGLQQILSSRLLAAYEGIAKAPTEVGLEADLEIGLDEVTPGVWQELEQLAPFGAGHPKPVFKLAGVKPAKVKTFGTGGIHLELGFKKENGIMVKAVGFFDVYPHLELEAGDTIHLLATLEKSYFGGRAELRLRIVDINPA